ncbi:MAG: hypothetical protein P1U56_17350, partial [Saprospiraceae bacterium]|nr:hypothetical protein [Saprospiraceae bacterium]
DITPNTVNDFTDLYIVQLPNIGNIWIEDGVVTLPDGTTDYVVDNQYCAEIPLFGPITAILNFKGFGAVEVTGTWENGAVCPLFDAGVGTDEFTFESQPVELTCESPCPPPPDCEIYVCANITPSLDPTFQDVFTVQLPTIGNVIISGGMVTVPGQGTFPLIDNQFCMMIPIFDSATAILSFKGSGAVEVTGLWPDGTECDLFEAGVGNPDYVAESEFITLDCEAPCEPTCTVEICATFEPNPNSTFADSYVVTLPNGGGQIIIQNGIVTLPFGGGSFPLVDNQFCAEIEIPIGTSVTAGLSFTGAGQVTTTATWGSTTCVIFNAGTSNDKVVKKGAKVTLSCDPVC